MDKKTIITISAADQRAIARKMLSGKWKLAVLGTLIYMLAISVPTSVLELVFAGNPMVSSTVNLAYLVLTSGAFSLGYAVFILHIFRQKETGPGEIFSGFEQIGRCIGIALLVGIIIFAFYLPSLIALCCSIGMAANFSPAYGSFAYIFLLVLGIALFYLPIKAAITYSQVFFIAADNRGMSVGEVVGYSKWLMTGNKKKYFFLQLSFFGWILLACIPTFIVAFYTTASSLASMAVDGVVGAVNVMEPTSTLLAMASIISTIGFLWLSPYMSMAGAAFYDIISQNLVVRGQEAQLEGIQLEETTETSAEPVKLESVKLEPECDLEEEKPKE